MKRGELGLEELFAGPSKWQGSDGQTPVARCYSNPLYPVGVAS